MDMADSFACGSSPCQNGGTCVYDFDATADGFTCTCVSGYSGVFCQTNIDECASTPCQNSGTCVDAVNNYACTCAAGYSGVLCQTDVNECASSPCQNSGTCTDNVNLFVCGCLSGYSGPNCQTNIDECASLPCIGGAFCADGIGSYTCGSCAHCSDFYSSGPPACPLKPEYDGNVTWLYTANGNGPQGNYLLIEATYMHSDGAVFATGHVHANHQPGVDFGGACGYVHTNATGGGAMFVSKHASCTGACVWVQVYEATGTNVVYASGTSIKLDRSGQVYVALVVDCVFGDFKVGSGSPSSKMGSIFCNSTGQATNQYMSQLVKLDPSATTYKHRIHVQNAFNPVTTRDVQIDNQSPVQYLYWMTQQGAGPVEDSFGQQASSIDAGQFNGPFPVAPWAGTGHPVDCVIWKVASDTFSVAWTQVIGDEIASLRQMCKGLAVSNDGKYVAVVSTVDLSTSRTLDDVNSGCQVAVNGGTDLDVRLTLIDGVTGTCVKTAAYTSSGSSADTPSRIAFGIDNNAMFITGTSANNGTGSTGVVFGPIGSHPMRLGNDAWIARVNYTAGAFVGVWTQSIESNGDDIGLDIRTDWNNGVVATGYFTNNDATCTSNGTATLCGDANHALPSPVEVNNTHVYVMKFDAITGNSKWTRVFTLNTTDPNSNNPLSLSAFGQTGYGEWSISGVGYQTEPTVFVFDSFTFEPNVTFVPFGYIAKLGDTENGISNLTCTNNTCDNGGTCIVNPSSGILFTEPSHTQNHFEWLV
jgi:hypothetical protein